MWIFIWPWGDVVNFFVISFVFFFSSRWEDKGGGNTRLGPYEERD